MSSDGSLISHGSKAMFILGNDGWWTTPSYDDPNVSEQTQKAGSLFRGSIGSNSTETLTNSPTGSGLSGLSESLCQQEEIPSLLQEEVLDLLNNWESGSSLDSFIESKFKEQLCSFSRLSVDDRRKEQKPLLIRKCKFYDKLFEILNEITPLLQGQEKLLKNKKACESRLETIKTNDGRVLPRRDSSVHDYSMIESFDTRQRRSDNASVIVFGGDDPDPLSESDLSRSFLFKNSEPFLHEAEEATHAHQQNAMIEDVQKYSKWKTSVGSLSFAAKVTVAVILVMFFASPPGWGAALGVLGAVGAFILLAAATFILSYLYKCVIMNIAKKDAGDVGIGTALSIELISRYSHIQKPKEKTVTGLGSVALKTLFLFAVSPILDVTYLPRRFFRKRIWAPLRKQKVADSLRVQACRELMLTVSANHFLFVMRSRRVIPSLRPLLLPGTSWMVRNESGDGRTISTNGVAPDRLQQASKGDYDESSF